MGCHGSPTCQLEFDDATGWLIGPDSELVIDELLALWQQNGSNLDKQLVLLLDCCHSVRWDTLKQHGLQVVRCSFNDDTQKTRILTMILHELGLTSSSDLNTQFA